MMLAQTPHHHGTAPVHSGRPAASGLVTRAAAPVVPQDVSESDFMRSKPFFPSSACEPPVQREPAPAGRLGSAGCYHHSLDTSAETPHRAVPTVLPRQSVTYGSDKAFHQTFQPNRSGLHPRQLRHRHARPSSPPAGTNRGKPRTGLPRRETISWDTLLITKHSFNLF